MAALESHLHLTRGLSPKRASPENEARWIRRVDSDH